jgi:hemerythrin-like metal-binding protein
MIKDSGEYLVGIPSIDKQHIQYVESVNKLLEAKEKGNLDKKILIDYVNDINFYALEHLDTEELLMRTENYPYYEKHLEKHNVFRDTLDAFIEELETKEIDINDYVDRLCECLIVWFKAELLRDDVTLAKFLKSK